MTRSNRSFSYCKNFCVCLFLVDIFVFEELCGFCNLRIITKAIFSISSIKTIVNRFCIKFLYKINRGDVCKIYIIMQFERILWWA